MKTGILRNPRTRRLVLIVSGLLAVGIAGMIFVFPSTFYAAYGIELVGNTNLTNELKAPAGVLFLAGLMMLVGAYRTEITSAALTTAAAIYLAYGLSRLLSIAVDGVPDSALVAAAGLEITIGAICVFALLPDVKRLNHKR